MNRRGTYFKYDLIMSGYLCKYNSIIHMGVGIFPLNETTISISRQRSRCNKKQTVRGQGQPGDGISSNSVMRQKHRRWNKNLILWPLFSLQGLSTYKRIFVFSFVLI